MSQEIPISTTTILGFDPFNPTGEDGDLTKQIFNDPVARVLFCFIKRQHIVSQHFHGDCLRIAKLIKKQKPKTVADLKDILTQAEDPALNHPWQPDISRFTSDDTTNRQKKLQNDNLQIILDVIQGTRTMVLEFKSL